MQISFISHPLKDVEFIFFKYDEVYISVTIILSKKTMNVFARTYYTPVSLVHEIAFVYVLK